MEDNFDVFVVGVTIGGMLDSVSVRCFSRDVGALLPLLDRDPIAEEVKVFVGQQRLQFCTVRVLKGH